MTPQEQRSWVSLADEFAALRLANEASRLDIAASELDPIVSAEGINEKSEKLLLCENKIRIIVERNPELTWPLHRYWLRNYAYQTWHWFDRRTDDGFDWTSQATELRRARDGIYQKLIELRAIKGGGGN